jgi:hypothetical protein
MQQGQQPGQNPQQPNTGGIQYANDLLQRLNREIESAFSKLVNEVISLDNQFASMGANMAAVMGQTQMAIQGLREETAIALPTIVGLGGTFKDVQSIQLGITQGLQTNTVLLGETASDLFVASRAVGVAAENVGGMVVEFENAGISAGLVRDNIEGAVDAARRVGVNTTAVFGLVQQNLSRLNEFGFQNGAVGLARMAAQSAALRLNMRDIFDFASRVFDPEGAINAVATFQRLGVAVGDLADPFRLMYLASEDVEELNRQVINMTEQFTYFDETTKEFKVFPNAKRDLREISRETGIAYDELVKMSIGQQKLNMITKDFRIAGIDEESKQFVANVAQYSQQKGGFVVKIGKDEKLITEINTKDIDEIKKLSQQPQTLEELAAAQLTETQLLNATISQLVTSVAAPTAASRGFTDVREVLRGTVMGVRQGADQAFGNQRAAQENINKFLEDFGGSISELISGEGSFQSLSNVIKGAIGDLEQGGKNIVDAFTNVDYLEVGSKYVSSGNLVVQGAQAAYQGLTSIAEKAQNFFMDDTPLTKPQVTTVPTATKVEFSEIKYQGNVNVTLNTPTGAAQTFTITDQMAYDLFQNPTFQKLNQNALQNAMNQPQYSSLPNLAIK